MKTKMICLLLSVVIIFSVAATALAAEARAATALQAAKQDFKMRILSPSIGSFEKSAPMMSTGGMSPWLQTKNTTIETCYWLIPAGATIADVATKQILVENSRKGEESYSFEFLPGYGGAYAMYQLVAGRTSSGPYDEYYVRGTWSPD